MFIESLLREAGVIIKDGKETVGIGDIESGELHGFINPGESVFLDVEDIANIPDRIPVVFESPERPTNTIFIDTAKLKKLAKEYVSKKKK